MKVLTLTNMYPPHHYGGYELICRDVMTRLRERGHTVDVLTTNMRVAGTADGPDEGVRRMLRFAWDDHVLLDPPKEQQLANEKHNQHVLRETLTKVAPDVVSVWNMGAMSLGLLQTLHDLKVPTVLNLCDDWLIYAPDLDPWVKRHAGKSGMALKIAERRAGVPCSLPDLSSATALFISEFTRKRAEGHSKMKWGRSSVTWSGIDERDFPVDTRGAATREWDWRLVGVGRIDERKGIEVAIRALALLPKQATLTWVGAGDAEELARLQALASELGVARRITWGAKPRELLRASYRASDAFVFPSTWAEPFGLVPIEAMACGIPVVGSGSGGSGEFLIDGVTALRASVGDPQAMADALTRLADDAKLRAKIIKAGAKVAKELTIGNLVDSVEAWHLAAADGFAHGEPAHRSLTLT